MGVQRKQKDTSNLQKRYRLMWMNVAYEPGEVKVVAFNKEGKPAAEKRIVTAGKPYKLLLEPDRTTISADGEDISFVTVSVVDKNGNVCPTAAEQLMFSVKGAGVYRAACSGDATSLEPFQLQTMKTFNGKLVVLVQATNQKGNVELTVRGKGLKEGKVALQSK
jgi:beta-galactosidase